MIILKTVNFSCNYQSRDLRDCKMVRDHGIANPTCTSSQISCSKSNLGNHPQGFVAWLPFKSLYWRTRLASLDHYIPWEWASCEISGYIRFVTSLNSDVSADLLDVEDIQFSSTVCLHGSNQIVNQLSTNILFS